MQQKTFQPAVVVAGGSDGHIVIHVTNAQQAVKMLGAWPIRSDTADLARRTCLDAAGGSGNVLRARKAFELAAGEAGILLEKNAITVKKRRASSKLAQRDARRDEIDLGARQLISREIAEREAKTAKLRALRMQQQQANGDHGG